jgi:hypothetical protein
MVYFDCVREAWDPLVATVVADGNGSLAQYMVHSTEVLDQIVLSLSLSLSLSPSLSLSLSLPPSLARPLYSLRICRCECVVTRPHGERYQTAMVVGKHITVCLYTLYSLLSTNPWSIKIYAEVDVNH